MESPPGTSDAACARAGRGEPPPPWRRTRSHPYGSAQSLQEWPQRAGHLDVPVASAWPTSRWGQSFKFKREFGSEEDVLDVRLNNKVLSAPDIPQVLSALASFVARCWPEGSPPIVIDFDFSQNRLDDESCAVVVQTISAMAEAHRGTCRLRVLKCFRSRASDKTCDMLARLILAQKAAVDEIHLSHNEIGEAGFVTLLAALGMHPGSAYPVQMGANSWPCWLRLAHNRVPRWEDLLAALELHPHTELIACRAIRDDSRYYQCTPKWCAQSQVPHVHLASVHWQDSGGVPSMRTSDALVEGACDQIRYWLRVLQSNRR